MSRRVYRYVYSAQPFGTVDPHYGLHTHFIRMATFLERMCMTTILKFLRKAVIYSSAHSTKADTVVCDWFLRPVTVDGTRTNVGIQRTTYLPLSVCD